jgi:putative transposase
LDAKVERVREAGGVRHKALVIAYGVHGTGRREVVGIDVGEAETEAFWRSFLRSLRARGLVGVQLVISDAHTGLHAAIGKVLGCRWQRCSVHFLRDMLGHVAPTHQAALAAATTAGPAPDPDRLRGTVVQDTRLGLADDPATVLVRRVGQRDAAADDPLAGTPYSSWLIGRMKSRPPPEAM